MSATASAIRSAGERFYHPELDALRFFAFCLIFIHHAIPHEPDFYARLHVAPALSWVLSALGATGAYGLGLFFMLSSYLVTELLIRERAARGAIDMKAFYIRRVLRMWPLYFFFLALAWAMQYFDLGQQIGWRALLAFLFLCGNWWIVFVGFPNSVIFPLWAVSVEEQFYIVWPSAMRRMGERGMMAAAAVMLAIGSLTRWYLGAHHTWESKVWCNTLVQFDSIALGILMAVLLRGQAPRLSRLLRVALFVGGFACMALAGNYFRIKADPLTTARIMIGYPVAALGALAMLLAVLRAGAKLERNPFVYLGRISYGLYTFHILGMVIGDRVVREAYGSLGRYLLRNAVAFAITIVFAAVSYRWLETPFLSLKQRFTHVQSRPA